MDDIVEATPVKASDAIWRTGLALTDKGAYMVHPADISFDNCDRKNTNSPNSQRYKLNVLRRGNASSQVDMEAGVIILPNPLNNAGITKKNIIKNAWKLITVVK